MRKAERQDSEMDNELMINTFLTLIPKNTIATQQKHTRETLAFSKGMTLPKEEFENIWIS